MDFVNICLVSRFDRKGHFVTFLISILLILLFVFEGNRMFFHVYIYIYRRYTKPSKLFVSDVWVFTFFKAIFEHPGSPLALLDCCHSKNMFGAKCLIERWMTIHTLHEHCSL